MEKKSSQIVIVGAGKESKLLTKNQKEFNRLSRKIEAIQLEIKELEDVLPKLNARAQKELVPLENKRVEVIAEIVRLFDRYFDREKFSKKEKEKLSFYISQEAFELLKMDDEKFADLRPIYEKHAESDLEEDLKMEEDDELESLKFAASMFTGEDFDDLKTAEEIRERLHQKMHEAEFEQKTRHFEQKQRRAERPKTEKQRQREAEKAAEEKQTTQSVREIYLDLVKTFHPDRELDPTEKERKNGIMQRVTEAYEANNLMALLQLQLEFERIDREKLENMADEKLKYFNKVLRQQEQELMQMAQNLLGQLNFMRGGGRRQEIFSASIAMYFFEKDVKKMKKSVKETEKQYQIWKDDLQSVKVFLKYYQVEEDGFEFEFPFR